MKSKQLKSPKPQHFHEFFTQKKIDNFSREIKVEFFGQKNEDFEQYGLEIQSRTFLFLIRDFSH